MRIAVKRILRYGYPPDMNFAIDRILDQAEVLAEELNEAQPPPIHFDGVSARPRDGLRFFHLPIFRPPSPFEKSRQKGCPSSDSNLCIKRIRALWSFFPARPIWMGPRIQRVREACVKRTPHEVRVNVSNVYEQSSDSIAIRWVDGVKLEGCNGATFGLGRTEEKDGDVHELGRRD